MQRNSLPLLLLLLKQLRIVELVRQALIQDQLIGIADCGEQRLVLIESGIGFSAFCVGRLGAAEGTGGYSGRQQESRPKCSAA